MNITAVSQKNVKNALKIINMTELIDFVDPATAVQLNFLMPRIKNVNHAPLD